MYPFSTRSTLLLGACLTTVLSVPAHAQGETPAKPSDITAEQELDRNDIIVTARRRSESAQDIPLAVSVLDARQLDETGAFNVNRLQQLAPTLQFYSSNPRNTAVNIRGVGVPFGLTSDGFEQGVGIYVDDVYYSRVASATFDFLDVAQIEVLRGPQGTLYGKNTTAGAINITTNQPSFDFEGRAEVSLGNFEFRQARLAISGPLSESVAARVAFSGTSRRGTIRNVATGQAIQSLHNLGLRAQVLWEAADNLRITLVGDFNKQDAICCGSVFVGTGTTQRPLNRQFAALAAAQGYTQEFRYAYTGDRFDFALGAFAFDQRIDTQGTEQHGPASSRWTINPSNALSNDPSVLDRLTARNTQFLESTSLALFGQVSWKVTDAFTIQPGARVNYDNKKGFYQRRVFTGTGTELLGTETDARSRAQLGVFRPQVSAPEDTDWNLTYDLTLSYALAPDVLAYGTYAKSFKTIGINQNGLPTDAKGQPIAAAGTIRPEKVDHFELGLKSQFWDRRATLNLAAFRTEIRDYQATVNNGQFGVLRGFLANADKVRS